jgi:hypothetical protein
MTEQLGYMLMSLDFRIIQKSIAVVVDVIDVRTLAICSSAKSLLPSKAAS